MLLMPSPGSSAGAAARPLSRPTIKMRSRSPRSTSWWCALAQAPIDHHERTLNAAEIDAVVSQTLARQALAAEQVRRASWRQVTERVAEITS
jgi:hypothetical protein